MKGQRVPRTTLESSSVVVLTDKERLAVYSVVNAYVLEHRRRDPTLQSAREKLKPWSGPVQP